jgi:hypothetical protein
MLYNTPPVKCNTSVHKTLFVVPTDAHYYKIIEMFKQFKIIIFAPTCFGSRRNHHQGAVLYLVKTTNMVFSVLIGIDAVNVMAAYQRVVQACSLQWRQEPGSTVNCTPTQQADMLP